MKTVTAALPLKPDERKSVTAAIPIPEPPPRLRLKGLLTAKVTAADIPNK